MIEDVVNRLRAAGCVFAEDEAALLMEAALLVEGTAVEGTAVEGTAVEGTAVEATLPAAGATADAALEDMVARRVRGEPLEYVVGFVDFCGLRLAVDAGVFVPRQRTRLLVREAAARLAAGAVVVDLACGSGAVGAAVATAVPGVRLYAVDIDPVAVRCARRNLARFGAEVYQGDLFRPLPPELREQVAVLVANVPYVPSAAVPLLPAEAREHEPLVALDGGPDGLDVMRRMTAAAPEWLAPGGYVLVETGTGQVDAALAALATAGLVPSVVHDEDRYATVVVGRR